MGGVCPKTCRLENCNFADSSPITPMPSYKYVIYRSHITVSTFDDWRLCHLTTGWQAQNLGNTHNLLASCVSKRGTLQIQRKCWVSVGNCWKTIFFTAKNGHLNILKMPSKRLLSRCSSEGVKLNFQLSVGPKGGVYMPWANGRWGKAASSFSSWDFKWKSLKKQVL